MALDERITITQTRDAWNSVAKALAAYFHTHLTSPPEWTDEGKAVRATLVAFNGRVWRRLSGEDADIAVPVAVATSAREMTRLRTELDEARDLLREFVQAVSRDTSEADGGSLQDRATEYLKRPT